MSIPNDRALVPLHGRRSSSFRSIKELDDIFQRLENSGTKKIRVQCKYCGLVLSTQEINRLLIHSTRCKKINDGMKVTMEAHLNKRLLPTGDARDMTLLKFIIKNDLSFSVCECPYLKQLIQQVRDSKTRWNMPTRKVLSKN